MISFEVKATSGSYAGQGSSREHLVQVRGISGDQVGMVTVNGATASKIAAGGAGSGWYVADQSANGRDNFTQPVGSVVVAVGRQSISKPVAVEITMK